MLPKRGTFIPLFSIIVSLMPMCYTFAMSGVKIIGHIRTDFPTKFGIPRQGIGELKGRIVFEPEFRKEEAFRGIEEFSHLWILWQFSESRGEHSLTVHPPRLGGKEKKGVFATRSPFRPSDIALTCVKLDRFELGEEGPVLYVSGIDMMDGSPVYDIKPYVPYSDCVPEASQGFTGRTKDHRLEAVFPEELLARFPEEKRRAARRILEEDPRPRYMPEERESYGVAFAGMDIHFRVRDGIAEVFEVIPLEEMTERDKVTKKLCNETEGVKRWTESDSE